MLGSRVSSIRNLLALAEPGWLPSHCGRARIPEGSPFAVRYVRPRRPAPTRKPAEGPFTTGVPCNPETGVGLLAAVVDSASVHLRVAEPVRAGARSILVVTTDIICDGAYDYDIPYCGTPLHVDEPMLACKLCRRRLGGGTIYMFMDMGFCTPECRYEYFLEELCEQRRKLAAETRARKRATWAGKGKLRMEAGDRSPRRIFFTCDDDEAEPFP